MSTTQNPLSPWEFEVEDQTALNAYTDELFKFARECEEQPGEASALKACGASRHVWNTAEGMIQANMSIPPEALERAIKGIELCSEAVARMPLSSEVPSQVIEHIKQMLLAMTDRRDDLRVLLNDGKTNFFRHLRATR